MKYNKLKYTLNHFLFIKALWSPFKPFKLKWYFGKTSVGVPYFLPRKWVRYTKADAQAAALKDINDVKSVNYGKSVNTIAEKYKNYQKALPKKIGFDFCGLGWKTKWDDTDYRLEWTPRLSFVCFGYQIAVTVVAENADHYWTAWLYYEKNTDHKKSKQERINLCRKNFPQTYQVYRKINGESREELVDYYETIVKPKYLKNDF